MTITLSINGKDHAVDAETDTPLLWVLRNDLALLGTKFGCGMALCAAPAPCISTINPRAHA
jgi:aerobic-type carbon monoxide dehydrogenase small subunit (CoxS/CutS family)